MSARRFGHDCSFPDYLYEFAANNREWSGILAECSGDYDVFRPGFHYVEAQERPEWQKRKKYDLSIYEVGAGAGYFGFNYRDNNTTKEKRNEIEWQGHAFAAHHIIYLLGADVQRDIDVVLFMLSPHATHGYDLLVGMHLAQIDDEDVLHPQIEDRRRLAVSRRVAAVSKRSETPVRTLERAAQNWIDSDLKSMGAVATLVEPRGRHLRGEED